MAASAHELTTKRDFSDLGGRLMSDGSHPTMDDWAVNPAKKEDLLFPSNEAANTYFAPEIEAIEELLGSAGNVSNTQVVQNLMSLAGNRPDIVQQVWFSYLKTGSNETRFKATTDLVSPEHNAKLLPLYLRISDRIKEGLPDAPESQGVLINVDTGLLPFVVGAVANRLHGVLANRKEPFERHFDVAGLWRVADPEMAAGFLQNTYELAAEIFKPAI